jgi:hypothetical protein
VPFGGANVTLSWGTTNANTVSINQGIGSVDVDGSRTVFVDSTKTFTLTVDGTHNDDDCTATVTVEEDTSFSCDAFNIDKSIVEPGESFKLTWYTTNADSVSINHGIGSVQADGDMTTSTNEDRTYVLTVRKGNETETCSDSVQIRRDTYSQGSYYGQGSYYSQGSYGGGTPSPRCEFDISAKKISKGKEVELSWETRNATEVTIEDNHGKVIFTTEDLDRDDKKDFYDGEIKVRPTKDTTYTLVAERGSKDDECKVSVDVESEITVLEVRDQKPVAGISLTQVPYTGFEAGPVLTFFFYTLLALWASFVGYIVIKRRRAGQAHLTEDGLQ